MVRIPRRVVTAVAACTLGLTALAACGGGAGGSSSGDGDASTITFGVGAPVLIDSTAPYGSVPQELGYWEDEGLDVTIQPTKGATASMQLLLAGKADIVNGGSAAFFQAAAKSPEIRVVNLVTKNIWQVTVPESSSVEDITDLEGATIGVQDLSSASYLFGRAAVDAAGLDADDDVSWLPVGVGNQAAAAFESGQIDAYATYDGPSGVVGNVLGEPLRNLPTPLEDVPGLLGIATTETFLEENRDVVLKFLIGINKGALFSGTNPEAALQIQWDAYPEQRPDGDLEDALAATLPSVQSRFEGSAEPGTTGEYGVVPMDDVQDSVDFMVKYGILTESLDVADFVDLSVASEASEFDDDAIVEQATSWTP